MIENEITITSFNDLFLYLKEESNSFFCSIIIVTKMLYALSTTNDIIGIIKLFTIKKYLKEL